uniref:Ig-like domain-containing protein n=1 Tax=Seriola lalandi dorsalis TaxID=1841481 RepID=A0A3B4Y8S5_SERLL
LRCVYLCVCLTASGQVEVQAFVGQDVLLPCSFPGVVGDLPPERVNVSWRNHGDREVLAIAGVQNLTQQHSAFRGRVTSFPDLYPQGNFSIVLRDVQPLDGGVYECHMVVDFRQRVQLGVTDPRDQTKEKLKEPVSVSEPSHDLSSW